MYYKYTLNKGKIVKSTMVDYDGVLDEMVSNTLVTEYERSEVELEVLFKLFGKED